MTFIQMMNANPVGNKLEKVLKDPKYVAEIKFDGCRYSYTHNDFVSKLGVRKGANVPHLLEALKGCSAILDGEVYYPGKDSNATTSVMGSKPGVALEKQAEHGPIRYVLYDILERNGSRLTYLSWSERRKYLESFYLETLTHDQKEFIDLSYVHSDKFGLTTHAECVDYVHKHKLEGFMFKNIEMPYIPGGSPANNWFKFKKEIAFDAIISGYTQGAGKYSDQIGSIIFSLYNDEGKLVECGRCSGFSDAVRRSISDDRNSYINRIIEVHAMEQTADGKFRHPVFYSFRTDKDPSRCHMHQI